jgi:hypothetical protein
MGDVKSRVGREREKQREREAERERVQDRERESRDIHGGTCALLRGESERAVTM